MRILTLNAGSSSLKASVLETPGLQTLFRTEIGLGADATNYAGRRGSLQQSLRRLADALPVSSIQAVGHRVVHGSTLFRQTVRIDDAVLHEIDRLKEFAPLHNQIAADTIRSAQAELPSLPQFAAFDTAFHASLTEEAFIYPVPYAWYQDLGIRRFGFHGLSVQWSVRQAGQLLKRSADQLGLVVAHLGSGCSVTAVFGSRSVDTSMGLTPMEGLMMGTRSGSIDPGILLYMLRRGQADWQALEEQLDHHSGLVGVSGKNVGMRELQEAAAAGDKRAGLAIDIFSRKAAAGIAAAAAALPRLDALVFTGGIGERSARVRGLIVARLAVLGIEPIPTAANVDADAIVSKPGATPAVLRVEAREDAVIAGEIEHLLSNPPP
jgi:acetate kinase